MRKIPLKIDPRMCCSLNIRQVRPLVLHLEKNAGTLACPQTGLTNMKQSFLLMQIETFAQRNL
jgi:hypothetical protein